MLPIQNSGAHYNNTTPLQPPATTGARPATTGQTASCPRWLYATAIDKRSLDALANYSHSDNKKESGLAKIFQTLLRKSPLELKAPPDANNPQALYQVNVKIQGNEITIAARFAPDTQRGFELQHLGMREDKTGRSSSITFTPQAAAGTGTQALSSPGAVASSSRLPPLAIGQQGLVAASVAASGSRVRAAAASSTSASDPASKASKMVENMVGGITRWEQGAARTLINEKLTATEPAQRLVLVQQLYNELSTKKTEQKLGAVKHWSASANIDTATEGRDTRTAVTRERQQALENAMQNAVFEKSYDNIINMVSRGRDRSYIARKHDVPNDNGHVGYNSPLLRRVFADSRGPVVAIKAIEEHIRPLAELARYNAIKDWQPHEYGG